MLHEPRAVPKRRRWRFQILESGGRTVQELAVPGRRPRSAGKPVGSTGTEGASPAPFRKSLFANELNS